MFLSNFSFPSSRLISALPLHSPVRHTTTGTITITITSPCCLPLRPATPLCISFSVCHLLEETINCSSFLKKRKKKSQMVTLGELHLAFRRRPSVQGRRGLVITETRSCFERSNGGFGVRDSQCTSVLISSGKRHTWKCRRVCCVVSSNSWINSCCPLLKKNSSNSALKRIHCIYLTRKD